MAAAQTKPYEFIGFGAMDVTKTYKFIWFGDIHGPKPYIIYRVWGLPGRNGDDLILLRPDVCIFEACPSDEARPRLKRSHTLPSRAETGSAQFRHDSESLPVVVLGGSLEVEGRLPISLPEAGTRSWKGETFGRLTVLPFPAASSSRRVSWQHS